MTGGTYASVNPSDPAVKADYIRSKKEMMQRNVVNIRTSSTSVADLTSWTFRTTGCDVVSVVTTTVPVKNGTMKDIKLHNKEMRRCVYLCQRHVVQ